MRRQEKRGMDKRAGIRGREKRKKIKRQENKS